MFLHESAACSGMRNKIVAVSDQSIKFEPIIVTESAIVTTQSKEDRDAVGVPKEIKNKSFAVGMSQRLSHGTVHHGHAVLVETSAGLGSGLTDEEYRTGARLSSRAPLRSSNVRTWW